VVTRTRAALEEAGALRRAPASGPGEDGDEGGGGSPVSNGNGSGPHPDGGQSGSSETAGTVVGR
jgi:hypothetical protein